MWTAFAAAATTFDSILMLVEFTPTQVDCRLYINGTSSHVFHHILEILVVQVQRNLDNGHIIEGACRILLETRAPVESFLRQVIGPNIRVLLASISSRS